MMVAKDDKQLEEEFIRLVKNIAASTPIVLNEKAHVKSKRIKNLEAEPEEWMKYYFPKFCFAAPAPFQKASTVRITTALDEMNLKGWGKFYQSRAWSRGLAKTTRRMMEIFYITFAKKFPTNMLLISKTETNATKLLKPYRANLEGNQRLINDYGEQKSAGEWAPEHFVTKSGRAFTAIGVQQNPRGSKEDEVRVNIVDFDDADDDETSLNPDRVDQRWTWVEKAVIPTIEIAKPYFIFFDNNIIAEDCLALRAQAKANDKEVINIRDQFGKSTWPEKNSEEMIDEMLANISYESGQGEYFNEPMSSGNTFPEIVWGKCPPLKDLQFVVTYADPSSSNKDMPGVKSTAGNSRKAVFIIGKQGDKYYIYFGFLDVMSSARFIDSLYACRDYIAAQTTEYYFVENNTLQDPIYSQIYLQLIYDVGHAHPRGVLSITPDTRLKGNKWMRIEATLEPINRMGNLIFNIDEKNNPHMQRLETQFKKAKPTSKQMDGPDAIEGGVFIIKEKTVTFIENAAMFQPRVRDPRKGF